MRNADLSIASFLAERLAGGEPAALLIVAATQGSAPGAPGFKMAVAADGESAGTIGGGAIERTMMAFAREALARGEPAFAIRRFIHQPGETPADAEPSGMICGGGQTVLLRICAPADRPAIEAWRRGETGRLIVANESLRFETGDMDGETIRFAGTAERPRYEEIVARLDTVHIVGGGHVGRALARALAALPLRIEVVDPRPETAAALSDLPAARVCALDYAEGAARIPAGPDRFVVIATPGHAADYEALRAVARRDFRYVAVVGSPHKAAVFRARLRAEGATEDQTARVRLPAGVPIGSRTPAEIALSIAAEIIAVRNGAPRRTA